MARDCRKVADLGGSCENDVVVVCTRGATRGLGAFISGPFPFGAVASIVAAGAGTGQLRRGLGLLRIRRFRTPGYRWRSA